MSNNNTIYKHKVSGEKTSNESPDVGGVSITSLDYTSIIHPDLLTENKVPFSFYRLGLRQSYTSTLEGHPKNAPEIKGHIYCKQEVREGYLYIHYEQKDLAPAPTNNWEEYKIGANGAYSKIVDIDGWQTEDRDFRSVPHGAYLNGVHFFNNTDIAWIAYSEQQWTIDYIKEVLSNSTLKEKRFQKLDVKEWVDFFESKDAAPIQFTYSPSIPRITKMDNNWIVEEYEENKGSYLDYYVRGKNKDKGKSYFSFCVNDPFGVADDLRVEQLKALTSLDTMLGKLIPKDAAEKASSLEFSYMHFHAITFYKMFYGDGYKKASPEVKKSIEGLRKNIVGQEFLEKVLMVKERAYARNTANNYRMLMLKFAQADYYLDIVKELTKNCPTRREVGICKTIEHHHGLAWNANLKDKHIQVEGESSEDKEVKKYLASVMNPWHPIYQLLSKKYFIEDVLFTEEKEQLKIGDNISSTDLIWANFINIAVLFHEYLTEPILVDPQSGSTGINKIPNPALPPQSPSNIKKTNVPGAITVETNTRGTMLVVNEKAWNDIFGKVEVKVLTQKKPNGKAVTNSMFTFNYVTFAENLKNLKILENPDITLEVVEKILKRGNQYGTKGAISRKNIVEAIPEGMSGYTKNIAIEVWLKESEKATSPAPPALEEFASQNPAKLTPKQRLASLLKVFDSKLFIGVTGIFSMLNLVIVSKSDYSNQSKWFSRSLYTAAIAEVLQFTFHFSSFYIATNGLSMLSTVAGGVSSIAMAFVSLFEAWEAYEDNNTTATVLYAGAALAFLFAGVLTLGTVGSSTANPLIIVATFVAVALFITASLYKFTPIEKYLANCVLQEDAPKKIKKWQNMSGNEIIEKLCLVKNDIVSDKFKSLRNLDTSIKQFQNLLTNIDMQVSYNLIDKKTGIFGNTVSSYLFDTAKFNCYFKNIRYSSVNQFGLRIFYSTSGNNKLCYKDIGATPFHTENGCEVIYTSTMLRNAVSPGSTIYSVFFYHRVVDDDTSTYPEKINGIDQYFIRKLVFEYFTTTSIMTNGYFSVPTYYSTLTMVSEFIDYCIEHDRVAMSLDQLNELGSILQKRSQNSGYNVS